METNQTDGLDELVSSGPAKIIVLANENSSVLPAFTHLKTRGYKVRVFHKLPDVISEISNNGADILMISWKLANVDVVKVYSLLTNSFKILCGIFAENTNLRDTSSMMRSGIPNAIYPPISSIGVERRIQVMLNSRNEKKKTTKKSSGYTLVSDFKGLPKNTKWNQVEELEDKTKIFEGIVEEGKKEKFYYFKGDKTPTFDEISQVWKSNLKQLLMFATEDKADSIFIDSIKGAIQYVDLKRMELGIDFDILNEESLEKFKDKEVTMEYGETKKDEKNYQIEKENNKSTLSAKDYSSLLAKCVKSAVEDTASISDVVDNKINLSSHAAVTIIKSKMFTGYLFMASALNKVNKDFITEAVTKLYEKMNLVGHTLENVSGIFEISLEPLNFASWAKQKADFFVDANHHGEQVIFAYIPSDSLPMFKHVKEEDLLSIKTSDLKAQEILPFDVYIYMPKNKKYLCYCVNGAAMTAHQLSKLANYKHEVLFIKKDDLQNYFIYCAKSKFLETASQFILEKKSAS
ncbi:MAG: hypothetical protein IPM57_08285 [Oligoflexia bacterium]|nr:hypothetical protein [Oligoflexia bacterium]